MGVSGCTIKNKCDGAVMVLVQICDGAGADLVS
jgi:hypothetical protein